MCGGCSLCFYARELFQFGFLAPGFLHLIDLHLSKLLLMSYRGRQVSSQKRSQTFSILQRQADRGGERHAGQQCGGLTAARHREIHDQFIIQIIERLGGLLHLTAICSPQNLMSDVLSCSLGEMKLGHQLFPDKHPGNPTHSSTLISIQSEDQTGVCESAYAA